VTGEWLRLFGLLAAAGAVGTLARFGLGTWLNGLTPAFPFGTLAVNVVGSFVLGAVWALAEGDRVLIADQTRRMIAVGFCGAFTTFSTFALDTVVFAERGQWLAAGVNVVVNNVLSVAALLAGLAAGRAA
jgi:CrcB protein